MAPGGARAHGPAITVQAGVVAAAAAHAMAAEAARAGSAVAVACAAVQQSP
jgi:hypothetical protein